MVLFSKFATVAVVLSVNQAMALRHRAPLSTPKDGEGNPPAGGATGEAGHEGEGSEAANQEAAESLPDPTYDEAAGPIPPAATVKIERKILNRIKFNKSSLDLVEGKELDKLEAKAAKLQLEDLQKDIFQLKTSMKLYHSGDKAVLDDLLHYEKSFRKAVDEATLTRAKTHDHDIDYLDQTHDHDIDYLDLRLGNNAESDRVAARRANTKAVDDLGRATVTPKPVAKGVRAATADALTKAFTTVTTPLNNHVNPPTNPDTNSCTSFLPPVVLIAVIGAVFIIGFVLMKKRGGASSSGEGDDSQEADGDDTEESKDDNEDGDE